MSDANDRHQDMPNAPSPQAPSKIQHTRPGINSSAADDREGSGVFRASVAGSPAASSLPSINDDAEDSAKANRSGALPVADTDGLESLRPKIVALGTDRKHEEEWRRTPNTTGSGAIHVRTFHAKLTDDALVYMDRLINEWLDAHPQYEVKFVHASIGILTGKIKEPHLICQVWV